MSYSRTESNWWFLGCINRESHGSDALYDNRFMICIYFEYATPVGAQQILTQHHDLIHKRLAEFDEIATENISFEEMKRENFEFFKKLKIERLVNQQALVKTPEEKNTAEAAKSLPEALKDLSVDDEFEFALLNLEDLTNKKLMLLLLSVEPEDIKTYLERICDQA